MKSKIFQISTSPICEDEYVLPALITEGEMTSISYSDEIEKDERKNAIKYLVEHILPEEMFSVNPDGESLTYHGGMTEWKNSLVKSIREDSQRIDASNVLRCTGPIWTLQKEMANPLNTEVLFITFFCENSGTAERSADFMRIVDRLQIREKLYIGAILEYHI